MLNFDELKDKVLSTAGTVAEKSVGVARVAADKTKILGKITKLNTDMARERDCLRKTYAEMGKMYYEKHKDDAEPEFQQACADVAQTLTLLDAKRKQLDGLKAELSKFGGDCDYEYYEGEQDSAEAQDAAAEKPADENSADSGGNEGL